MTATDTETTWTFDIPEQNAHAVRAKVAKLQRRAVKLGIAEPTITEGEPRDVTLKDEHGRKFIQRYIPFTITQDAPVRFNGWSFVATIDHGTDDSGDSLNVLRAVPSYTGNLPKSYRTDAPTCDHCRTSRRRNETFVVHHEDGELRRIGRNCCADYLGGQEAKEILARASWLRQLRVAFEDGLGGFGFGGTADWRIGMAACFSWTATAIRLDGWTSRGKARHDHSLTATADTAWDAATLACGYRKPRKGETLPEQAAQDHADAELALEWARDIDPDTDSDYLHNLRVVCGRGSVSYKEMGLAASAVAVYQRERDKLAAEASRVSKPSEWLGEIGQRFGGKGKNGIPAFEGTLIRRHSFEGQFGTTTILVAQDVSGNEVITFSSGYTEADVIVGKRITVTGTIKRHSVDSRSDRKQTNINRASFTLSTEPAPVAPVVEEAATAPTHTEAQAEPVATQEPSETVTGAIVLTAKRTDGSPFMATFTDAAAAVEAGVQGRADGSLNWRTIRYTINGAKTNTPALRKLARGK